MFFSGSSHWWLSQACRTHPEGSLCSSQRYPFYQQGAFTHIMRGWRGYCFAVCPVCGQLHDSDSNCNVVHSCTLWCCHLSCLQSSSLRAGGAGGGSNGGHRCVGISVWITTSQSLHNLRAVLAFLLVSFRCLLWPLALAVLHSALAGDRLDIGLCGVLYCCVRSGRLDAEVLSVTRRVGELLQKLPRDINPVNLEELRRIKQALVELENKV